MLKRILICLIALSSVFDAVAQSQFVPTGGNNPSHATVGGGTNSGTTYTAGAGIAIVGSTISTNGSPNGVALTTFGYYTNIATNVVYTNPNAYPYIVQVQLDLVSGNPAFAQITMNNGAPANPPQVAAYGLLTTNQQNTSLTAMIPAGATWFLSYQAGSTIAINNTFIYGTTTGTFPTGSGILTLNGVGTNITLNGTFAGTAVVPIIQGGTGQTTASAAINALGGAPVVNPNVSSTNIAGAENNQITQNGIATFPPYDAAKNLTDQLPFLDYNVGADPNIGFGANLTWLNVSNAIIAFAALNPPPGSVIAIDDGWMVTNLTRTTNVAIAWNTTKFPNGISGIPIQAHAAGLKAQIYLSEGNMTCLTNAGSLGYEFPDVQEIANWHFDWLKVDQCGSIFVNFAPMAAYYQAAIQFYGNPMGLIMSETSQQAYNPDVGTYGTLVNMPEDGGGTSVFAGSAGGTLSGLIMAGVDKYFKTGYAYGLPTTYGRGHFFDEFLLQVNVSGNSPCTTNDTRKFMSIAALLSSPVIFDGSPSVANWSYMTNAEIFNNILRDPGVYPCQLVSSNFNLEVLAKRLQNYNGGVAVGYINRGISNNQITTVTWPQLGIPVNTTCVVHDPWNNVDVASVTGSYAFQVNGGTTNDMVLYVLVPQLSSVTVSNATVQQTLTINGVGTSPAFYTVGFGATNGFFDGQGPGVNGWNTSGSSGMSFISGSTRQFFVDNTGIYPTVATSGLLNLGQSSSREFNGIWAKTLNLDTSATIPTINATTSITVGASTNTASFTLVNTNFISGGLYTNLTGRPIMVSANATLTTTGVSGNAALDLRISNTVTNHVGISTIVTSVAQSYTNMIMGIVPNGQTFTFTNVSSGAGDSAGVNGGQYMVY